MYKQHTILALIPARGGSKGIPGKNIKLLADKPLIVWTIEAARQCSYIDRLIISTDDQSIAAVAAAAGCEVPFIRPAHLATDSAASMDVIMHALDSISTRYDYVLLLQPTSPFRTVAHINDIIERALDTDSAMMISVAKLKKHPASMYQLEAGYLQSFIPTKLQARRQDMPAAYEHNGAMYLAKTDYLRAEKSYNASLAQPYEMFGYANLDLDELDDWAWAEYVLATGRLA
ncbi:MAG: cytidylyltransferase domain-containing protein [Alishewanella aestuarii]